MNPSILFNTSGTKYQIVRVKPETLSAHITDSKAFNNLIRALCDGLGHDVMDGGYQALPLGSELAGRWMMGSPCGQENTTPAAAWCYEERIALATTKDTHPLMILPAHKKTTDEVKQVVEKVLGADAISSVKSYHERTALDDILDQI